MQPIRINGERLWHSLMQMADIGATANGGCNRQALTDSDQQGRELFLQWCRASGYTVRHDAIGNLFVRRAGENSDGESDNLPAAMGSHLDTQPTGGRFDGVLGVLAGLEVLRSLDDHKIATKSPLEVIVWSNEEGARFSPAMMGSAVYAEKLSLSEALSTEDAAGIRVGAELQRLGYDAPESSLRHPLQAYFELHIEQGPLLEQSSNSIGVVTGGQAIRWYDVRVCGQETHAGPMPMALRKDPVMALPQLLSAIYAVADKNSDGRATIGQLQAHPGSRNVVPGQISLTIDLRHPAEETLQTMDENLQNALIAVRKKFPHLSFQCTPIWHSPVVRFADELVVRIRHAAETIGCSHQDIVSGAGHDAFNVATKTPTAMIFIPCADGLSHNEQESATPQDCEDGGNVLLHAVLQTA